MAERFETHARTFSLLTMVSRVTGLARDAVFSRLFGAAGVMDAFFFAFIIPNLFRRLFGEGALSAAFLRVYARLDRTDPLTARRLATLTVAILLVALGGVTLAGELVLYLLAHFLGGDQQRLAVRLTMIMLPYMPMVCLVAVLGAMLQVHGRFGPTAAAPILLNLCLITAALGLAPLFGDADRHIVAVAGAVVVAGTFQVTWMVWSLRDRRWVVRDVGAAREPARRMLRQLGPMILGLGVLQVNVFFDGVIASYPTTVGTTIFGVEYPLREGAMAAVSFAQRLYQFPLGVVGIAVATTIYPVLARLADDESFGDILRRGLRLVVFVGVPASAGLMMVGPALVTVFYQGGLFDPDDSQRVAFVLLGYASGVWAYSMIHVLTRAFYARGDSKTPVKVALWMVALNLALNCALIWTPLAEAGLAWSTAGCAAIQAVGLLAIARRRQTRRILDAGVLLGAVRVLAITAVMVAVVALVQAAGPDTPSWPQALVVLLAAVGAGVGVVAAGAAALRMPELRWTLGR